MAVNFSGVKAISIPEGNVKRITDSAGRVLWKTAENSGALENYTWAQIAAIGAAGTGAQYFNIGDTKTITLNGQIGDCLTLNNYQCKVFILDFNYRGVNGIYFGGFKDMNGVDIALCDSEYEGYIYNGTKCFNFNHWSDSNYGGWKACDARYDILGSTDIAPSGYGAAKTTSCVGYDATSAAKTNPVANTLMAALPADLRTELEPWTVYSDNTGNKSNVAANVTTSVDYLPLLSEFEVRGARSYSNQYEQTQQSQMAYFTTYKNRVKYKHNDTGTICGWWNRSPGYNSEQYFCFIDNNGGTNIHSASLVFGLAPAFRIA